MRLAGWSQVQWVGRVAGEEVGKVALVWDVCTSMD